jgi:hypothetical protein
MVRGTSLIQLYNVALWVDAVAARRAEGFPLGLGRIDYADQLGEEWPAALLNIVNVKCKQDGTPSRRVRHRQHGAKRSRDRPRSFRKLAMSEFILFFVADGQWGWS